MKTPIHIVLFIVLTFCISSEVEAQSNELKQKIIQKKLGTWNTSRRDPTSEVGDTMIFLPRRRNRYPFKLKKDGSVKRIVQRKNEGSCGTYGLLESVFLTRWKKEGSWSISYSNDKTFLIIDQITYELVDLEQMSFIFLGNES